MFSTRNRTSIIGATMATVSLSLIAGLMGPTTANAIERSDVKRRHDVARIVQANIFAGLSHDKFNADLRRVVDRYPDFITLNEATKRSKDQITPRGYASYRSTKNRSTLETPVLWRTDRWEKKSTGTRTLTTGSHKWATRSVNWVTLKNRRSGKIVSVVSAHPAPASIPVATHLNTYMNGLAKLTNQLGSKGGVLVGGDLNVIYGGSRWPARQLNQSNLTTTFSAMGRPRTGTHGANIIDYVLYRKGHNMAPIRQRTFNMISDHDAVMADFSLN